MDSVLIEYLSSGEAWLLVGSGPSIEMGYPTWAQLAQKSLEVLRAEQTNGDLTRMRKVIENKDYPEAFKAAVDMFGSLRIRQILGDYLKPTKSGKLYEMVAAWPVKVYLTTNYDDEIQLHLAKVNEAYRLLSNSTDHMGMLNTDLSGAIVKLHGDLSTDTGLILTSDHYKDITSGNSWEYWRTRMISVFQMCRMFVLGHSLSDANIKHVLNAAKRGAGVERPVCWIAPNVSQKELREYLERYRIRVIPYESDAEHTSLLRLIEAISDFIPQRTSVPILQHVKRVTSSSLKSDAAAPGFYVFNKFCEKLDLANIQAEIATATMMSIVTELRNMGEFSLEKALSLVGWPGSYGLQTTFRNKVATQAVAEGLLERTGKGFKLGKNADGRAKSSREKFIQARDRFIQSVALRIKAKFPALNKEADEIATYVEASLTGFFREAGLTLSSVLIAGRSPQVVPSSVLKFVNLAAARYDTWSKRQAFSTVSIDIFKRAGSAEREYLGRISRGFFAFHALGVLGDVALERMKHAKETVWLIDSNVQIIALAVANIGNYVVRECLSRLRELGIRSFTTYNLFSETVDHLRFAESVVKLQGANSRDVMAAAKGDTPYRQSNEFLRGFISWQKAGNPCDWKAYLYKVIKSHEVNDKAVASALSEIGIETVPLQNWPGFSQNDYSEISERTEEIRLKREQIPRQRDTNTEDTAVDSERKAVPEGEASIVIKKERGGSYYILTSSPQQSDAWFISSTSILNLLGEGSRITWQPESFFQFASTLCRSTEAEEADKAFDTILLAVAESGVDLLDDETIKEVFGGVIDQAETSVKEQRELYSNDLESKYGEPPEVVLSRIAPMNRPLAALQFANEAAQIESTRREQAEKRAAIETKRAESAEKELARIEKFRRKYIKKQSSRRKKKR
ncbi:MAG: SIR2 family protein [Chloroflexi bacterium]|nr:SIR2 family protein [Chloroflexota bacterium]